MACGNHFNYGIFEGIACCNHYWKASTNFFRSHWRSSRFPHGLTIRGLIWGSKIIPRSILPGLVDSDHQAAVKGIPWWMDTWKHHVFPYGWTTIVVLDVKNRNALKWLKPSWFIYTQNPPLNFNHHFCWCWTMLNHHVFHIFVHDMRCTFTSLKWERWASASCGETSCQGFSCWGQM